MQYFVCLIFFVFTLTCCKNAANENRLGIKYNVKREQIGLPLLDSSWMVVRSSSDIVVWGPSKEPDLQGQVSKLVAVKEGQIYREENLFIGKFKYSTVDGEFRERLYVACEFDKSGGFVDWDCDYYSDKFEHGKKIKKAQADSIVALWGGTD